MDELLKFRGLSLCQFPLINGAQYNEYNSMRAFYSPTCFPTHV